MRQATPQGGGPFPFAEAQHAADFLQRETLAAQFRDYGDLDHLAGAIQTAVPFMTRRDYFSLVPPLQLPEADIGHLRYFTR